MVVVRWEHLRSTLRVTFKCTAQCHYREGDGAPLQCSCLEHPTDGGAWWVQSMGSLRVGHDWAPSLSLFILTHWRRKWQPTPVFLPGESQGRGSLVGRRPWGRTESATTEATWQQQQQQQHSAINYYNHQDAHQLSTIYSSSTWKFLLIEQHSLVSLALWACRHQSGLCVYKFIFVLFLLSFHM